MCRQPVARARPAGAFGQPAASDHDDLRSGLAGADVLIDFTRPEGTLAHLAVCRELACARSSARPASRRRSRPPIADHARHVAIVMAPNMSVGVNVVLKLLDMAARALAEGYDIEVIEAHHRHKVDAPSGTALAMGEVLAHALGPRPEGCAVFAREGLHRRTRPRAASALPPIRGGDIVGDHTVLFAGTGERIEITHRSPAAPTTPRAACARRASWPDARRACTAWTTCSACRRWQRRPAHAGIHRLLGPERRASAARWRCCCWRCRSAPGC